MIIENESEAGCRYSHAAEGHWERRVLKPRRRNYSAIGRVADANIQNSVTLPGDMLNTSKHTLRHAAFNNFDDIMVQCSVDLYAQTRPVSDVLSADFKFTFCPARDSLVVVTCHPDIYAYDIYGHWDLCGKSMHLARSQRPTSNGCGRLRVPVQHAKYRGFRGSGVP
ncbi:hypothetical protein BDR06DRAFT_994584 [Suillus hirtellus]|nr:hypothetical protein BDR06DRAFT_994584 [Suillus hirtellus]